MKQLFLMLLLSAGITSCEQSVSEPNRKQQLDFEYPSVDFTSEKQVKRSIEGMWEGNHSILSADTGLYRLKIVPYEGDRVTVTEYNMTKGTEPSGSIEGSLVDMDHHFVIHGEQGAILAIHYLSDKQLKLNENLFERTGN